MVERAETLLRDLQLVAVRRWKDAHPGAKAIGFMPVYVPRELIHAAGMLPVGIFGGGDMVEIVKGDAYYQSYICHLPRSTIELALDGSYSPLDGMIFPSICDVIRNLSGMWQILFPDRYVRYLDVPQNFDDGVGGAFFARELRDLLTDLERLGGRTVSDDDLRRSILLFNDNRARVAELYALRSRAPWQVPTSELYLMMRAGNVLPVEEHTALLRDYLDAARGAPRRPMDMARVVLRGCFCEQPPYEMIRTLERAGCYIVDDDWVLAARWPEIAIPTAGDPLRNIVRAFLHHSPECPSIYQAEGTKGDALIRRVRETAAEGVLFTAASFCDPALLDQPMAIDAVKKAGIPYATFLFSETTGNFQVIREQAGTFADSIKLA
ncbi:MAG: benzoyl-CoA reductase subunit C [Planctomycetes bacterium]|nr:benzoyl-CoA reductase subunit C [Planctomycetota bacterium]